MNSFFILAAGFGKRMGHWTKDLPKPMLKVDGVRLLDFSFFNLSNWGYRKGFINIHYHRTVIREHLQHLLGFDLVISEENKEILGTAGGIQTAIKAQPTLDPSPLLLYNPDMVLIPEPGFLPRQNLPKNSKAHLYLLPIPENAGYTGLSLGEDGLVSFGNGRMFYIGLGLLDTSTLATIPMNTYADLSDIFRNLAKSDQLTGELFPGTSLDLGEQALYESSKDLPVFGDQKQSILDFLVKHGLEN